MFCRWCKQRWCRLESQGIQRNRTKALVWHTSNGGFFGRCGRMGEHGIPVITTNASCGCDSTCRCRRWRSEPESLVVVVLVVLSKILLSYIHKGRRRLFGRSCRNRRRRSFGGGGRGSYKPRSISGGPGRIENSLVEHFQRIARVLWEGNQSSPSLRNFMGKTVPATAFTLLLLSSPEPLSFLGHKFLSINRSWSGVLLQVIRRLVPTISTRDR